MEKILTEIKNVAGKVATKSSELVEVSKIKLSIINTKSNIDEQFKKLGELVYSSQRDDSIDVTQKLDVVFAKIDKLYQKLAELEESSAQVSNKKICPACKKFNAADAEFCSRCGENLAE